MSNTNDFLPEGYKLPQGPSNYVKFESGETKLRILSRQPIMGWEYFNLDKKPVRIQGIDQPVIAKSLINTDKFGKQPLNHFWGMIAYNYNMKCIQVWTETRNTILEALQGLASNPDWGSLVNYDVTINKSGSGKETTYTVTPVPPKPVSDEVKKAYMERPVALSNLFIGKDPFEVAGTAQPVQQPVAKVEPVKKEEVFSTENPAPDGLPF